MPGSISDVKLQDVAYVKATLSAGPSVIGMDDNPELSRPLNTIYLDEKIGKYYTSAISHHQQEFFQPASDSVMDMGIAITTNTAKITRDRQLLTPGSPPISPAYYCPFPLPSRSTSLRATTSIMMINPPPVPPKDIKNPSTYPFPSIPLEKKSSLQQTPVLEERNRKGASRRSKCFRKRFRGVLSRRIGRDFHIRKSTLARIREGKCAVM